MIINVEKNDFEKAPRSLFVGTLILKRRFEKKIYIAFCFFNDFKSKAFHMTGQYTYLVHMAML